MFCTRTVQRAVRACKSIEVTHLLLMDCSSASKQAGLARHFRAQSGKASELVHQSTARQRGVWAGVVRWPTLPALTYSPCVPFRPPTQYNECRRTGVDVPGYRLSSLMLCVVLLRPSTKMPRHYCKLSRWPFQLIVQQIRKCQAIVTFVAFPLCCFFSNGSTAPWGPRPPHCLTLHDHTQTHHSR
jgi:hypothetical protein